MEQAILDGMVDVTISTVTVSLAAKTDLGEIDTIKN
jgi:hypothetical protein